jgi:hypothetical protein
MSFDRNIRSKAEQSGLEPGFRCGLQILKVNWFVKMTAPKLAFYTVPFAPGTAGIKL